MSSFRVDPFADPRGFRDPTGFWTGSDQGAVAAGGYASYGVFPSNVVAEKDDKEEELKRRAREAMRQSMSQDSDVSWELAKNGITARDASGALMYRT